MNKDIKKHNIIEKSIKNDIIQKNTLRRHLTKELNKVARWSFCIQKIKNQRKKKKYIQNIKRYVPLIEENKKIISKMIQDLEMRIKDEMKYSEKEIEELKSAYQKEYSEMIKAQNLLLKAKKGKLSEKESFDIADMSILDLQTDILEEDPDKKKKPLFPREFLLAKAQKRLKGEAKDLKKVKKELTAEENDKKIFQAEIKRMVLEKEILK